MTNQLLDLRWGRVYVSSEEARRRLRTAYRLMPDVLRSALAGTLAEGTGGRV